MSTDLWEQLAEAEVPAPPPQFEREVHRRLNKALLVMHLADLFLKGMAFAIGHFAQAVLHLLAVTFTGRLQAGLPRKNETDGPPL
jgi:hypothetical protein